MASNPIVQTSFTADPAPMVHDGVVYLYTSHDDDNAPPGQGRFLMRDWKCYSSTDMVNWTDHGSVLSLKTFPWAVQENDAWAPHAIERNGKFYFYAPISVEGWPKNVIAVAVADHPLGPFKDVLGRPLIDKKTGYIDPGVFIDDDGQAYLYFGNPQVWYVKLNEGMKSEPCDEGGMGVYPTREGAYLKVQGVNFGDKGPASFQAHVASANDGGTLEIRLEGPAGPLLGSCDIPNTGGPQTWKTVDCPIEGIMGVHDLYFTFKVGSEKRFSVDWWQFKERGGAR